MLLVLGWGQPLKTAPFQHLPLKVLPPMLQLCFILLPLTFFIDNNLNKLIVTCVMWTAQQGARSFSKGGIQRQGPNYRQWKRHRCEGDGQKPTMKRNLKGGKLVWSPGWDVLGANCRHQSSP